jgi:hypothetical protein
MNEGQKGRIAMIELTESMREALSTNPEGPLWLVDPTTKQTFVVLRKEDYDRVKTILGEEDDVVLATGELVDRIMAEDDANDPLLDSYRDVQ